MRVAYVCADSGVPIFGCKGCSVHVQEWLRVLIDKNVEVDLFATNIQGTVPADLHSVRIHPLPLIKNVERAQREIKAFEANQFIARRLQVEGPFDVVYERYSLWSYAAMEYARDQQIPGILEINASLIEEQATHRVLIDRSLAEDVFERVIGAASLIITVSNELVFDLNLLNKAAGRVHVVPNGVNAERFLQPTKSTQCNQTFAIGFLGTLKPWHDLSSLVTAFKLLRVNDSSFRLLIVGDGPERTNVVEQLRAEKLLDYADFAGAVQPEEVPALLAQMDVAVAPYSAFSKFYFSPLKIFEYMAAGIPVVASRIGQIKEIIRHEVNGLLYSPGDSNALAIEIGRLKKSPKLRSKLAQAGRLSVIRDHTWESAVHRVFQIAELSEQFEVKIQ